MSNSFDRMLDEYQKRVDRGEQMEDVIASMHTSGLSMFDTTRAVKRLFKLSLRDAQRYVLEHPIWAAQTGNVLFLDDIVRIYQADPSYSDWVEWYYGKMHIGIMLLVASSEEKKIQTRLQEGVGADEKMRDRIIRELADNADEMLNALVTVIALPKKYDGLVVELALRTIRTIGYPRNAPALRWVVNLAVDQDASGREEAIRALQDIDTGAVIPYLLGTLVNNCEDNLRWSQIVHGVCKIVLKQQEWALACGPAIAHILAQYEQNPGTLLDPTLLLGVLEQLTPTCTYAIPVLYSLAIREKENEIGQKAYQVLLLFGEDDMKYYRYHLRWLSE